MILDIPGVSERRQSPRYAIQLDVDLVLEDSSILNVISSNISSCGMQVTCDSMVTNEIEPRGIQSHSISHIRLKAITCLPLEKSGTEHDAVDDENQQKLYACCRIISVQRKSQDQYSLNLAFIEFENGTEQLLDRLIEQYEQKKTVIKVRAIA